MMGGLREVRMRVDESRQNHGAAPVSDHSSGMRGANLGVVADCEDAAVGDRQSAVGVTLECVFFAERIAGRVPNRRAN